MISSICLTTFQFFYTCFKVWTPIKAGICGKYIVTNTSYLIYYTVSHKTNQNFCLNFPAITDNKFGDKIISLPFCFCRIITVTFFLTVKCFFSVINTYRIRDVFKKILFYTYSNIIICIWKSFFILKLQHLWRLEFGEFTALFLF